MAKVPLCTATKRVKADPKKGIPAQTVHCICNEGHLPKDRPLHYGLIKKNDGSSETEVWS